MCRPQWNINTVSLHWPSVELSRKQVKPSMPDDVGSGGIWHWPSLTKVYKKKKQKLTVFGASRLMIRLICPRVHVRPRKRAQALLAHEAINRAQYYDPFSRHGASWWDLYRAHSSCMEIYTCVNWAVKNQTPSNKPCSVSFLGHSGALAQYLPHDKNGPSLITTCRIFGCNSETHSLVARSPWRGWAQMLTMFEQGA